MNVPETKACIFCRYTPNVRGRLIPSSDEITVLHGDGAEINEATVFFMVHDHVVSSCERKDPIKVSRERYIYIYIDGNTGFTR